jgi:hypothetical protein
MYTYALAMPDDGSIWPGLKRRLGIVAPRAHCEDVLTGFGCVANVSAHSLSIHVSSKMSCLAD